MSSMFRNFIGIVLILIFLFILAFGFSLFFFPEWLGFDNWATLLLEKIFVAALIVVGEILIGQLINYIFDLKSLKEWFSFKFGNKYKSILLTINSFTNTQIGKEINSKRYIPSVFIESLDVKEKLRYFCEPEKFYEKVTKNSKKEIEGSVVISTLRRLDYPLLSLEFPKLNGKMNLTEAICSINRTIDQYYEGVDIFDSENQIKPEYYEKIPREKRYLYHYLRYDLDYMGSYRYKLNSLKESLDLLSGKSVLIIGKAGSGKTNFVCDFAENYLLKKKKICLYFSGRDFNQMADTETLEEAISRFLFTENGYKFLDLVRLINFIKGSQHLYIIIDGINEHKNLVQFSQILEQFIQRNNFGKCKIILTCRSEYLEERFGNLQHLDNMVIVKMDDCKVPDSHVEYLVESYFKIFDINLPVDAVSENVMKIFSSDKLMLRFFCEAYQGERGLQELYDLYRLDIFETYLEKKEQSINGLRNCLYELAIYMFQHAIFTNLPIDELSEPSKKIINAALYENVVLGVDIVVTPNSAFGKREVVNFVYDEFREFVLASYLLGLWEKDKLIVSQSIEAFTQSEIPIAEGLQKYLCLWVINNKVDSLLELLSQLSFFDSIYIKSIFNSPDRIISQFEQKKLAELFWKSPKNSFSIFKRIISRCNPSFYRNLNITFLFSQINKMDDDQYELFFENELLAEYGYSEPFLIALCENIKNAFIENRITSNCRPYLFELLIYLSGVRDQKWLYRQTNLGIFPAKETLFLLDDQFSKEEMLVILEKIKSQVNAQNLKSIIQEITVNFE